MPTQIQLFQQSHRRLMDRIHHFAQLQRGPNPLTAEEIARLARRFPQRWAMFARTPRRADG